MSVVFQGCPKLLGHPQYDPRMNLGCISGWTQLTPLSEYPGIPGILGRSWDHPGMDTAHPPPAPCLGNDANIHTHRERESALLPSVQTCRGSSLSRSTIAGSKIAKFKIRQTLDKANSPNFNPAKFSGYTVYDTISYNYFIHQYL